MDHLLGAPAVHASPPPPDIAPAVLHVCLSIWPSLLPNSELLRPGGGGVHSGFYVTVSSCLDVKPPRDFNLPRTVEQASFSSQKKHWDFNPNFVTY